MENNITQGQEMTKKGMDEQKKERLIKLYKKYSVIDWIIAIAIIATPFVLGTLASIGLPSMSIGELMYFVSSLPALVMIPIFLVYSAYTIFCFWLYVKVWPIKEIPKGGTYWFDWILTIALTAYELFIFYIIFTG